MKLHFLTEDDAAVLRQIITDHRRRNRTKEVMRDGSIPNKVLTPETYVAGIPDGGIPILRVYDGDPIPGSAVCTIYRLRPVSETGTSSGSSTGTGVTERLEATYFNQTVYNVSTTLISVDYKIVWRDKYGDWFTEGCPCP